MDKTTQFKINSVSDIEKHYEKYGNRFIGSLQHEIDDFNYTDMNYMVCLENYYIHVDHQIDDYSIIQNPYINDEPSVDYEYYVIPDKLDATLPLIEAMKQIEQAAKEADLKIEITFKSK